MNYTKVGELIVNPINPRIVKDDKYKILKESLASTRGKDVFEARPVIVSNRTGSNIIIAGNTRYRAAKDLGWKEVPTVIMEGLTEEQEQEIIIRDNVSNGEWDWDILGNEWDASKLVEWGLDIPALEVVDPEVQEDDFEVPDEDQIKTDIVLGDLIEIGQHRLLCGDSTQIDQVEKVMNGEKADMVFTDPPYGMKLDAEGFDNMPTAKGTTHKSYTNVIGDGDDFTPELISTIFACFPDTKEIFIWGADYFAELIPNKNDGSWIVWDKRQEGGMDNMFGASFELCWSKQKHKREIARVLWAGYFGMSKDDTKTRVHPTQKPIDLATFFFNKWGNINDLVADLFLGSGSTMVACHQLNRKCYGIELDPKYCQVIVDRMRKLDSSLVIKINGTIYEPSRDTN